MNYCMIATGNHRYFDSLRDAPRPGRMQFVFADIRCEIVTLYRRAVEGAGPYVDIRRTPTNYNLPTSQSTRLRFSPRRKAAIFSATSAMQRLRLSTAPQAMWGVRHTLGIPRMLWKGWSSPKGSVL